MFLLGHAQGFHACAYFQKATLFNLFLSLIPRKLVADGVKKKRYKRKAINKGVVTSEYLERQRNVLEARFLGMVPNSALKN